MKITKQKRTVPAKQKSAVPAKQQSRAPTHDGLLESPGGKWRMAIGPLETVVVAKNAPLCQMVVQNRGPAVVEVCCEASETIILMAGKLAIMEAYGGITIACAEEDCGAVADMEFSPRTRM